MKPLIMVVEDNPGVALNIRVTLEFNDYEVITALNGKMALKKLNELEQLPDLIISDIMMPEMDGYEFFKTVSENIRWNQIPFIFLTARATPDDIRIGKLLGIDDYLTKPFKEEDLLATIAGKISRKHKIMSIARNISQKMASLGISSQPSISSKEKSQVFVAFFNWDEAIGPKLEKCHPVNVGLPSSIQNIGTQLFIATASIYGQQNLQKAQGLLLPIENINKYGYIYFDSVPDKDVRGGHRRFMLAVIAPMINYFESLQVKKCLEEVSEKIKLNESWEIETYWNKIFGILSKPVVFDEIPINEGEIM
ncbi:MAG: response regulator [Candidatus Helarchaeota archaeon]